MSNKNFHTCDSCGSIAAQCMGKAGGAIKWHCAFCNATFFTTDTSYVELPQSNVPPEEPVTPLENMSLGSGTDWPAGIYKSKREGELFC